jgi:sensor domain CHASE-containing protein/nitrogen-specific signal transduction histidine kinase
MTLRKKTLLIVGLTLSGLMITLYLISQRILLNDYSRLEEDRVRQDLQRTLNTIDDSLSALGDTLAAFAWWDDTYQFMLDQNEQYIADNMIDVALLNSDVNVVLFISNNRGIVFSRIVENELNPEVSLESEAVPYLKADSPLLQHADDRERKTGIIFVAGRPVLVASNRILTSFAEGPARGTLIFGQYLDESRIQQLSDSLHLPMSIYSIGDPQLPLDFQQAKANLSLEVSSFLNVLEPNEIGGYALLKDILGNPALISRIVLPRTIYQQGQVTLNYFLLALLALGLVFGVVVVALLEKTVLARVARLSHEVLRFGTGNDLSSRVTVTGHDELTSLATSVNTMLHSIEIAHNQQQQLNQELQKSLEELADSQAQKDRFFTHAAHEFRTPLTHFRTYLYLLGKRPERVSEYLPIMEKATTQLGSILEDVFDLARFGRREVVPNKQSVSLEDIITTIMQRRQTQTEEKEIRFSLNRPQQTVFCMVDNGQMTTAFDRVLAHMINATPVAGSIAIEMTSSIDTAVVRFSSSTMVVEPDEDSGLFQPFYTPSEGGMNTTGLGLTTAKRIIDLHGGQIHYEPLSPGGGIISINLPLAPDMNSRHASKTT